MLRSYTNLCADTLCVNVFLRDFVECFDILNLRNGGGEGCGRCSIGFYT